MFNHFLNTENNSQNKIKLFGDRQQQHTIILKNDQQIEYFKLDKIIEPCKIQNLKACDYVLVDHDNEKILFCELKNAKNKGDAIAQLWHSKNIVDCLTNILDKSIEYKRGYVVFNNRALNKRATKVTLKLIQAQHFKYTYTGKNILNFEQLNYAK